jgi:hypothetical protein
MVAAMNKLLVLTAALLLSGCPTTVPVRMHFPQIPEPLIADCPVLEPLAEEQNRLSDLLENANKNYGKHYECAAKHQAWQEWYNTQKKIFEEVK